MIVNPIIDSLVECLTGVADSVDRHRLEASWIEAEKLLQTAGHQYFVEHPQEDRAPYTVFVRIASPVPGVISPWCLVVCVGQKQIDVGRQGAYAQIVSGELGRNIVRRHAG